MWLLQLTAECQRGTIVKYLQVQQQVRESERSKLVEERANRSSASPWCGSGDVPPSTSHRRIHCPTATVSEARFCLLRLLRRCTVAPSSSCTARHRRRVVVMSSCRHVVIVVADLSVCLPLVGFTESGRQAGTFFAGKFWHVGTSGKSRSTLSPFCTTPSHAINEEAN